MVALAKENKLKLGLQSKSRMSCDEPSHLLQDFCNGARYYANKHSYMIPVALPWLGVSASSKASVTASGSRGNNVHHIKTRSTVSTADENDGKPCHHQYKTRLCQNQINDMQ